MNSKADVIKFKVFYFEYLSDNYNKHLEKLFTRDQQRIVTTVSPRADLSPKHEKLTNFEQ